MSQHNKSSMTTFFSFRDWGSATITSQGKSTVQFFCRVKSQVVHYALGVGMLTFLVSTIRKTVLSLSLFFFSYKKGGQKVIVVHFMRQQVIKVDNIVMTRHMMKRADPMIFKKYIEEDKFGIVIQSKRFAEECTLEMCI